MRHIDDIMNAENWNTDIKKPPRHKKTAMDKTPGPGETQTLIKEGSPELQASEHFDFCEVNYTQETGPGNEMPLDKIQDTLPSYEQPPADTMNSPKDSYLLQQKPDLKSARFSGKRNRRKNKSKWLFVLSGLLVSIVSGVIVFAWLVRSDNRANMSAQESVYDRADISSDGPESGNGELAELALLEDNPEQIDQFADNSATGSDAGNDTYYEDDEFEYNPAADPAEALLSGAYHDTGEYDPIEAESLPEQAGDAGEEYENAYNNPDTVPAPELTPDDVEIEMNENLQVIRAGETVENVLFEDSESAGTSDTADVEVQVRPVIEASEVAPAAENRRKLSPAKTNDYSADEKILPQKDDPIPALETASVALTEHPAGKTVSAASYEGEKAGKVKELSQRLVAEQISEINEPSLAENKDSVMTIQKDAEIREQDSAANNPVEPESSTNIPDTGEVLETARIKQPHALKENLVKNPAERTGVTEELKADKSENTIVDKDSDIGTSAKEKSSTSAPVKSRPLSRQDTDPGTPLSTKAVIENRLQENSEFPSGMEPVTGNQPDSAEIPATNTGTESSGDTIQTAIVENKISAKQKNVPSMQLGMSSILKKMSVNYEDQFNAHDSDWPEYNNRTASAVIEDGTYHIEHKEEAGDHILLHSREIPVDMDFMLEVLIMSVRSRGDTAYGIVFGAKDNESNYSFQIRNDHLYSIEKMYDGNSVPLAQGKIDNIFIKKDSQKTLKVVKQGNRVHFYIDNYYIDEIPNVDFAGDKTGFLLKGAVRMSVDWTKTQVKFQSK